METIWRGNVRDMVRYTAHTDARETVVDSQTGAKIRINIADAAEPGYKGVFEPFYIESPDGETIYDAYNRKEAITILSNIRKGMEYPDLGVASLFTPKHQRVPLRPKKSKKPSPGASVKGMR